MVLKTLTLFQTKIYDFSYPFSEAVGMSLVNVKITREINEHVHCENHTLFQTKKEKLYPISD